MQIFLLATFFAIGFLSSLRLGPLVVVPFAIAAVLAALFFDVRIGGSMALAAIGLVAALNIGYLLGAVTSWRLGYSERLRSILSVRRFMR